MHIKIVAPSAPEGSRSGNAVTAARWSKLLRSLGHRVSVSAEYKRSTVDMLIALHAFRSAPSVARFRERYDGRPLVVCLTGTDYNQRVHTDPETTLGTMRAADALVRLHDAVAQEVPPEFEPKLHTIHQSVEPHHQLRNLSVRHCEICVVGHMRDVKDPLRAAYAVRGLPEGSRIRVTHIGAAFDDAWETAARSEMRRNARYRWAGALPPRRVRKALRAAHAMVISSLSEGGANVVGEAIVAGAPVLASEIPGNIGLLGEAYAGYFPVQDTDALRSLLLEVESNPEFLLALEQAVQSRAALFAPEEERARWAALLDRITQQS